MTNKYAEMLMRQQQAEKAMKVEPKTGTREVRDINTSTMKTERSMPSKTSMQEAADAAMRAKEAIAPTTKTEMGKKKGGCVKMAKGGSVGSASKRADGCAIKGKTRGKMV